MEIKLSVSKIINLAAEFGELKGRGKEDPSIADARIDVLRRIVEEDPVPNDEPDDEDEPDGEDNGIDPDETDDEFEPDDDNEPDESDGEDNGIDPDETDDEFEPDEPDGEDDGIDPDEPVLRFTPGRRDNLIWIRGRPSPVRFSPSRYLFLRTLWESPDRMADIVPLYHMIMERPLPEPAYQMEDSPPIWHGRHVREASEYFHQGYVRQVNKQLKFFRVPLMARLSGATLSLVPI